eukprot:4628216-Prymnesium_polylepis.1
MIVVPQPGRGVPSDPPSVPSVPSRPQPSPASPAVPSVRLPAAVSPTVRNRHGASNALVPSRPRRKRPVGDTRETRQVILAGTIPDSLTNSVY